MKNILFSSLVLMTLFIAGCDNSNDPTPPAPPATIIELHVEPKISLLDVGTSEHYKALAEYSDGVVSNVSDQVSWSLENDSGIIEPQNDPDNPGLALAVMPGKDNIVATLDTLSTKSAVTVVDVTLVSLVVSPKEVTLSIGNEQLFTAEGTYGDGHTQDLTDESSWTSNNTNASISGNGIIKGESAGSAIITATIDAISDTANVDVRDPEQIVLIEVRPVISRLFVGSAQQFSAYAYYADGSIEFITNKSGWYSSDYNVAAPDLFKKYLFDAKSEGNAVITADLNFKNQGTALIVVEEIVLEDIVMTPRDISVAVGETRNYFTEAVASDGANISINNSTNQSYSVADESIAYISNNPENKGQLIGLEPGTTTVISTFEYEGTTYTDQTTVTIVTP